MDEGVEVVSPWQQEPITDNCIFFRHVPIMHTSKNDKKRRFPNESHFSLHPEDDGLSFNWSEYADQNKGLIVLGLTKGKKGDFINIKNYLEFKIPVSVLKKTSENVKLSHDPLFNGNPSDVGKPNNKSHALFTYDPDDVEIRVQLSHYCNSTDDSFCVVNHDELSESIARLQERANDTPYHKLWEFNEVV